MGYDREYGTWFSDAEVIFLHIFFAIIDNTIYFDIVSVQFILYIWVCLKLNEEIR